jgi:hypothetical protein
MRLSCLRVDGLVRIWAKVLPNKDVLNLRFRESDIRRLDAPVTYHTNASCQSGTACGSGAEQMGSL